MYFTTFNHYDDDNIDIYNNIYSDGVDDTCLICWDPSTPNNKICKMTSFGFYFYFYKSCTCNGSFHPSCLLQWINITNSCPICRIKIENHHNSNQKLPLTFNILKIFKYICIMLFAKIIYDIIFGIHFAIEKKIQNDQCELL